VLQSSTYILLRESLHKVFDKLIANFIGLNTKRRVKSFLCFKIEGELRLLKLVTFGQEIDVILPSFL